MREARHRRDNRRHRDTRHTENRQLTHGIESTELNQDHVDNVGLARDLLSVIDVPLRDLRHLTTASEEPHRAERSQAHGNCHNRRRGTAVLRGLRERTRLEAQHQHHQHDSQDFHHELRQCHIRCAQQENLQRDTNTGDAEQHSRLQTVLRPKRGPHANHDNNQRNQIGQVIEAVDLRQHRSAPDTRSDCNNQGVHREQTKQRQQVTRWLMRTRHLAHRAPHTLRDAQRRVDCLHTSEREELAVCHDGAYAGTSEDEAHADSQHNHRDDQRHIHAVPQAQVRFLSRASRKLTDRIGHAVQRAVQNSAGSEGGWKAKHARDGSREPQRNWSLSDVVHVARTIHKCTEHQTCRVRESTNRTNRRHRQQNDDTGVAERRTFECGQHAFLRHEAEERRNCRHRCRTENHRAKAPRHLLPQRTEATNIARACLVINHTSHHEQRRLKHRVRNGVHNRSHNRELRAHTNRGDNPTQLRDRRVRNQLLQVSLLQRKVGRGNSRPHTHDDQQQLPHAHVREDRGKTHQQVNACLDDGRSVQESRDGSCRRHGLWKPGVEGELSCLRESAQGHQRGNEAARCRVGLPLRRSQNLGEIRGTG